jgi:DNA-binding response OmpR family regulator
MGKQMNVHILLVDGSSLVRALLQCILEELGYTVSSAADSEQALRLVRANHIDLALLDIDVPEVDGYKLYAELRKHRTLPAIFTSSSLWSTARQHALKAGAAGFLTKPFQLSELDRKIKSTLQLNEYSH